MGSSVRVTKSSTFEDFPPLKGFESLLYCSGVLYACWKGKKSLARRILNREGFKRGKDKIDAEFAGENEASPCPYTTLNHR